MGAAVQSNTRYVFIVPGFPSGTAPGGKQPDTICRTIMYDILPRTMFGQKGVLRKTGSNGTLDRLQ